MDEQSAFPYTEHCRDGMTLRDYFAAKAMQVLYQINWEMFMDESIDTSGEVLSYTASEAYEMADAMMKAREA